MHITAEKLAKKYARACINLFVDQIDRSFIEQLDALSAYLYTHRALLFYVQRSALDGDRTKKKVYEMMDAFEGGRLLRPLVDLLIAHKRIFLLPSVMQHLSRLALEKKNIMKFTIESAPALSSQEREVVHEFLTDATGKQIISRTVTNKDLIAGVRVYSATLGFEQSIRKQLRALKSVM